MDKTFMSRMDDLAQRAVKTGCAYSKFITPAEASQVMMHFKFQADVSFIFDGGFDDFERARCIFLNPDWGAYERDEVINIIRISHRPQDSLGHRDYLGAIMSLGVTREVIGDIVCDESGAYIACVPEMSEYLIDNLSKIGSVGVRAELATLSGLPSKTEEIKEKTDSVASLRLDAIVSSGFNVSRTKAAELISSGKVSLNHLECESSSKPVEENDIIAVRGMGRIKLLEVGKSSRKGRIFITLGVYPGKNK